MTFGGWRALPRAEEKSGRALHQVRPQGHGNHTGARISQPRTADGLAQGVAGKRRKAHGPQPRATRVGAEEGRGQALSRPCEARHPPPGASLDAPGARRSSPSGSTSMHPAREGQRSPGRSARPRRPLRPGAPERFQPVYVLMTRSAPRKRLKVICAVMRNVWPCITWHQV